MSPAARTCSARRLLAGSKLYPNLPVVVAPAELARSIELRNQRFAVTVEILIVVLLQRARGQFVRVRVPSAPDPANLNRFRCCDRAGAALGKALTPKVLAATGQRKEDDTVRAYCGEPKQRGQLKKVARSARDETAAVTTT